MGTRTFFGFIVVTWSFFGCGRVEDQARFIAGPGTDYAANHWYPDEKLTPGHLCSTSDPDFDERRYAEQIPHCARNVDHATRVRVSAPYGVSESELKDHQVDHLIPLAIGGSNSDQNLWPVPYASARAKAKYEFATYNELKSGRITQDEAIARIREWVRMNLIMKQ